MITIACKDQITNLFIKGYESQSITNENVDDVIHLLKFVAENDPDFLLDELVALSWSQMVSIGIAILLACSPVEFVDNESNKDKIFRILLEKIPSQLLECVEILKSGNFPRKFGSRSQKLIRKVMETWGIIHLEEFKVKQPQALYALVKLVHPRYNGYRGEIIKNLINR